MDASVVELGRRGFEDLRPQMYYAMSAIDSGADSASALGRALSVTKQAAAKTISTLVNRGWVAAEEDPADRRKNHLTVSALGHRALYEGEVIFDELRQAWVERIGEGELRNLENQLAAFVEDEPIRLSSPGWVAH